MGTRHDGILSDPEEKQAVLKEIIKALHAGEDMAVVKQRFGQLISGVQASEIAKMEQALMEQEACPQKDKTPVRRPR